MSSLMVVPWILLIVCGLTASPIDPLATKETKCLYSNLYNLTHSDSKSFIFGHHQDNFEGQHFVDKTGLDNKSDILVDTNQFPGFIEYNLQSFLNGNNFTNHILNAIAKGLMIGFHYPANNPVTGGTHKDLNGDPIINLMPGHSANTNWTHSLDKIAVFLKTLKFRNGNTIPMIIRPFHENLGNWNWWGANSSTPQQYKAAYNYTRWYLQEYHSIHSLLFVYAPDKPFDYYGYDYNKYITDRFPGTSNIDIVAFDYYGANDFHQELINNAQLVVNVSKQIDKIAAIGEFGIKSGLQNTNITDWFTKCFYEPLTNDLNAFQISYCQTWTDTSNNSYWIPLEGQINYNDFKTFSEQKYVMFENRLPNLYECNL